jgi:long-chain acyl-CoA synthetase
MNEEEAARRSHSFRQLWGLNDKDVHLVCSPFGHSAPHRFAMRTLESGGRVIVGGKFEPLDVLSNVSRHRVTSTFMVPTHLERILRLEPSELRRHDLSSMRLLAHAGAPISEETKLKAMRVFPARSMWEFYGSTEGPATRISPEEWHSKKGSVGRASGTARIRILNEELEESPVGEVGEVWIEDADAERFSYWGDKAKTEAAWRGDSYSVGDLGWVDTDGYLYLTGRRHDTIITGGVNVYPQEVELSLLEHPQIEDAVVFGVVNQEWGQEVRAQVVPVAEHDLDEETVRAWLSRRIATYKCPRRIEFVRSLQRTATGKLIRTGLDDLYN